MDFRQATDLCTYLSKDYAEGIFSLLVNYHSLSASETASRLNLHIQTAQDFLEAMTRLGILSSQEVHEGKRPYQRYTLIKDHIFMEIDLASMQKKKSANAMERRVREKKDSGAHFAMARGQDRIASITLWTGVGRERKERRMQLTDAQGQFLYHLPFPDAETLSIEEIIQKAGIQEMQTAEILDILEELEKYQVIETS